MPCDWVESAGHPHSDYHALLSSGKPQGWVTLPASAGSLVRYADSIRKQGLAAEAEAVIGKGNSY